MFKAVQEFTMQDKRYEVGDEVEAPTMRMIELGIVAESTEESVVLTEVSAPVEVEVEAPVEEEKPKFFGKKKR